jgi:tetratricopeptide (TPR) repeat protein
VRAPLEVARGRGDLAAAVAAARAARRPGRPTRVLVVSSRPLPAGTEGPDVDVEGVGAADADQGIVDAVVEEARDGAAVAVTLAVATGAPEPPCRGAERGLAGVWDAPRKAAIAAALRRTGAPFVEATVTEVMRVGDDRAARWIAMHTEACTATRIDGAQTEAVLGLRMACLDDRRRALAAFGDRMLEADREVAAVAVRAVYRIGDVEACADVATLSAPVPPPADAETRARVDALRVELAAVKSQRDLGLYKPGLAAARALTPRAVELGYRPLEADVRVIEGILASDLGEFADAERSLDAALWAAEASRHDVAAAHALIELIWVVGERRGRPDDAERLEARATATLERLGRPAELGAELDVATATIALDAGKLEAAEVDLRHAVELLERKFGPDDLRLTDPLRGLGIIELQRRRGAEADAYFQRALAIRGRVLSPDHPSVGQIYEGIGGAQFALDQLDDAAASYDRALAIFERAYGPGNWQVANVLHNRAQVDTWRGKEVEALAMLRRVVEIDERALGPDHTSTIDHRDTLALTYEQVGRNDEARTTLARNLEALRELPEQPRLSSSLHTLARIELARRDLDAAAAAATEARAVIERLRGPDGANYGLLRTIGEIDLARGRPAEALAPLELAMARLDQTESELEEALTRGMYGRALYDAGTDRKRGAGLVRDAYRVLAADPRVDELAAELRDWLRQRRLL